MSDYSDDSDTSSSEEEEEIEVPEEVPAKKERKKYVRKPMSEEQKETLKERLAVARDAKKKKSILKQTDDYEEPVIVKQPKKVKEVEPSTKKVKKEKEVVPITIAIDPVENKKNDKQTIVNNYYYNTPAPSSTPVKPVKTPKTKPVKKIDIPEQVIDTPIPTRRYYNPF